ncbi:SMC5-SMC6 complex localization factor protein 2 isoform X2 [Mauremys reevesii]|uniref:SMC5-SMC6 complex localization factor protein 2 isoform X2 n=1 Tax=Mauremys reevesii TaxID=260615 RepID=UPI00193FC60D|nr:SMC5-SMC6 complex localization factor protein 2 isoform X2 [Mauremys reevesii]
MQPIRGLHAERAVPAAASLTAGRCYGEGRGRGPGFLSRLNGGLRAAGDMTRHLSAGSSAQGSPGRHFKPAAAGREGARDCRNQSITDFFKPAPKQDKRNVKKGDVELSVIRTERFEKKISSQKKTRREKIPVQSPNKSPVMDDLLRGANREKNNSPKVVENNRACLVLSTKYPKVVVRKLFMSGGPPNYSLTKKDTTSKREPGRNEKCPIKTRTPLFYENGREQRTDCMDLEEASSDASKWVSTSKADILKNYARSHGNVNNKPLCQKAGHSAKFQYSPGESQYWLPLETYCKEEEQTRQRMEQSKLQPFSPVKVFLGTGISNQGNGCLLRKRSSSASWETASDDSSQSKQVSKPKVSSSVISRWSSEKAVNVWKNQSFCLNSKISSGLSKQKDFTGKRQRISMNMDSKSSGNPVAQTLNEPHFSRSFEKCKTRKSEFIKHVLESPGDGVLQRADAAMSRREDLSHSQEYFDISHKKEKDKPTYEELSPLYSGHRTNKNDQVCVADTKENQLQATRSHFLLEKPTSLSQENATVKTYLHELTKTQSNTVCTEEMKCLHSSSPIQSASSSQVLETKKERDGVRQTEPVLCKDNVQLRSDSLKNFTKSKENTVKTSKDNSNLPSVEIFEKPVFSVKIGKVVARSLYFEDGCSANSTSSSQISNELNIESSNITSVLNRKLSNSSDSEDESFDYNLDSDEEEMLLPLQDILSSSSKPHVGTPKEACLKDLSQDSLTPSPKLPLSKIPVMSRVSYVNSLEHLLKEKEESKRVDDLEKQLQEDIQEIGLNLASGEEEQGNSDEDGDLSEEHRAFIKRFSVVSDAIPDYHPGEEIFHLSNSGKIFNQHNLDLRNSGFIPQNPIEKLIFRSEVTQQLSLTTQGFLSCAYSCTQCPIPVLKWLFQMMSVHSDYYVSMQILDTLMDITIKNASISDAQSKVWIPPLSDISAVLINMGVPFRSLFPLQHLQPTFSEDDILSEMQITVGKQTSGDTSAGPAFSCLPETNLINVVKFLSFCTSMYPDGYADQEILLLLLLLFKISLEKVLKQIPLIDFQCLLLKLLKNIRDWDAKMPQLCLTISELSSHHHDLLWLVQLVPSWVKRGRQIRRHLSLTIISKLLNKNYTSLPVTSDLQMSLLYQYLVQMKPSNLLKKKIEARKEQQDDLNGESDHTELEQQAYYLTYSLLHLVSEVSCFDIVNSNQRKCLLRLCGALEKHVKCDIREDARLFYRTKVKDLVARIYGKWQEMIQNSRPTQGKLHDFWEPDL